jgi:hypothetical protein
MQSGVQARSFTCCNTPRCLSLCCTLVASGAPSARLCGYMPCRVRLPSSLGFKVHSAWRSARTRAAAVEQGLLESSMHRRHSVADCCSDADAQLQSLCSAVAPASRGQPLVFQTRRGTHPGCAAAHSTHPQPPHRLHAEHRLHDLVSLHSSKAGRARKAVLSAPPDSSGQLAWSEHSSTAATSPGASWRATMPAPSGPRPAYMIGSHATERRATGLHCNRAQVLIITHSPVCVPSAGQQVYSGSRHAARVFFSFT